MVARELLGKILAHRSSQGILAAQIVETEAYLAENDPASHSWKGLKSRNASMFQAGGTAYIYFIYGMHFCFNVVTNFEGVGEAVLIRAAIPLLGIEVMKQKRKQNKERDLCRGPGRLCQAFGFDKSLDGSSLLRGPIGIYEASPSLELELPTKCSGRIGIQVGVEHQLRFYLEGSPFVSA